MAHLATISAPLPPDTRRIAASSAATGLTSPNAACVLALLASRTAEPRNRYQENH